MHIATSTDLSISVDTMHKYVSGLIALKTMMRMLSHELDRGAQAVYPDAMEARVRFNKMSPLSTQKPSWMTKLGISSPPSTITRMSKSWSHHNGQSVSDVLHGLLKPFLSHMGTCALYCNILSSVISSVDSWM